MNDIFDSERFISPEWNKSSYDPNGFVCPEWAKGYWNPRESTIEKCVDGKYAVVCHQIQTTIYFGTKQDCELFLKSKE